MFKSYISYNSNTSENDPVYTWFLWVIPSFILGGIIVSSDSPAHTIRLCLALLVESHCPQTQSFSQPWHLCGLSPQVRRSAVRGGLWFLISAGRRSEVRGQRRFVFVWVRLDAPVGGGFSTSVFWKWNSKPGAVPRSHPFDLLSAAEWTPSLVLEERLHTRFLLETRAVLQSCSTALLVESHTWSTANRTSGI